MAFGILHNETYFRRMAGSIGDKSKILQFLKPGRTLDFGAGGGELSEVLRLHGHDVIAVDKSEQSVQQIYTNFPHVQTFVGSLEAFAEISENIGAFDNIVACSVMHEVFSYSPGTIDEKEAVVQETIQNFAKLLKPGGTLIIRDGVMPDLWQKNIRLELADRDAERFLHYYIGNSPFTGEERGHHQISFEKISEMTYSCDYASAMEYLFTLTWGWESAPREVQELYGVYTTEGYREVLQKYGFSVSHMHSYLQPGYVSNLSNRAAMTDEDGNSISLPCSNMMLVASAS